MWAEAVQRHLPHLSGEASYDRLSLFQPATHPVTPAISLIPLILSVSIWYNVLNQFMIQRVLGAKDEYHARMGIVFAGWLKILMPVITVLPGLILFAMHPEILLQSWEQVAPAANQGYVALIQSLIPVGLRGLLLAALFGGHWGIENSLHWQLDVTFREDQCCVRKGHADVNLSLLRRMALSLLKQEQTAKVGVKNKRLLAAWDIDYLTQVIFEQ